MYPNIGDKGVSGVGGGASAADWKAGLPEALKSKAPTDANGFTKIGNIFVFTKDGVALDDKKGYKESGEETNVFEQAAKPDNASKAKGSDGAAGNKSGNKAGNGAGNGSAGLFGFGFTGTGADLSNSWMNMGGGFEIDPNKMMKSAGLMGFITSLSSMIPFGLGGLLSQGALQASMASFMNAIKFNFDFSNLNLSGDNTRTDDSEGASGSAGSVDTSKVPDGYEKTDTDGVFKKDGKYYKYDNNNKLVECKQDGTALAAAADDSEGGSSSSAAGGGSSSSAAGGGSSSSAAGGSSSKASKASGSGKKSSSAKASSSSASKSNAASSNNAKKQSSAAKANSDPRPNFLTYKQFTEHKGNLSVGVKSDVKNPDGSRTVTMENGKTYKFDSKGRLIQRADGTILKYNGDDTRPSETITSKGNTYYSAGPGVYSSSTNTKTTTTKYTKTTARRVSYDQQKQDWDKKGIKYSYSRDSKTGNYTLKGPTATVIYDKNGNFLSETRNNKDGSSVSISYKNGYEVRTTKTQKWS